jgi:hypothetical protein
MSTPTLRARTSLPCKKSSKIPVLLACARVIYAAMLAQAARFPAPIPTLVRFLALINALDLAEQALATSARGTAIAPRNSAREALWVSLRSLQSYVQGVADANLADGVPIIKSAGFDVAKQTPHDKPVVAAALTGVAGEVKLEGNVRALTGGSTKRVLYNWAYSLDGGHTWLPLPATLTGKTSLTGLPLMTSVSFRVSVTVAGVVQSWSQPVTLAVH